MPHLAEDIITVILTARTLDEAQKAAMLDKFGDESISDDDLKTMLDALCDAEISLREQENVALERMRRDNNAQLAEEEAKIAPEKARLEAEAQAEEQKVVKEYVQEVHALEGGLDKVEEAIVKNSKEADEMGKIRKSLGI